MATATMSKPRVFTAKPATRTKVPLLVGLAGPSGGGKTFSALRLATGMQRVTGGKIYCIDTESRRMCHYAEQFKFQHVEFGAPFGSLDYLAAIEFCIAEGAGTIIIDSMSHEHEGPGGLLESHEAELTRMAGDDYGKRNKMTMLAWAKPKAARRRLINTVLQIPVNFIFCFRAKEKIKMRPGKDPEQLGWMPIAGEEFVYEMMVNALLLPNAGGVPTWMSNESGEKQMIKLPHQFRNLLLNRKEPLDESIGEAMAKWAAGEVKPTESTAERVKKMLPKFANLGVTKEMVERRIGHAADAITDAEISDLGEIFKAVMADESRKDEFFPAATDGGEGSETSTTADPDFDAEATAQSLIERAKACKSPLKMEELYGIWMKVRGQLTEQQKVDVKAAIDEAKKAFAAK